MEMLNTIQQLFQQMAGKKGIQGTGVADTQLALGVKPEDS